MDICRICYDRGEGLIAPVSARDLLNGYTDGVSITGVQLDTPSNPSHTATPVITSTEFV